MKVISRDEFSSLLAAGHRFVWASLYERQDFMVQLTRDQRSPVRDITDEPEQFTRKYIGQQ
jgi:hypothetical protein